VMVRNEELDPAVPLYGSTPEAAPIPPAPTTTAYVTPPTTGKPVPVLNPPAPPPPAPDLDAPPPPPPTTSYSTCVAFVGAVQKPDPWKIAMFDVGIV
jgi:hypothetical protein